MLIYRSGNITPWKCLRLSTSRASYNYRYPGHSEAHTSSEDRVYSMLEIMWRPGLAQKLNVSCLATPVGPGN